MAIYLTQCRLWGPLGNVIEENHTMDKASPVRYSAGIFALRTDTLPTLSTLTRNMQQ